MKRRVHAFKGHGAIAVEGHDIKLGRGGIREIEFFAQTQQLIAGGRHPELRTRGTIETLERLAAGGWIAPEAASELTEAYLFLRRIENRLQMVGDEQTHIIPAERDELERVARLSGFADTDAFGDALLAEFKRVEAHYGALFEKLPEPPSSAPEHRRRPMRTTRQRSPRSSGSASAIPQRRSPRSAPGSRAAMPRRGATRARERLTEFLPSLLDAFGRTAEPDLALATFDKVIAEMPAGLAALLAACRQSEPAQADRRHHGHGAAARPHHRRDGRACSTPCSIPGFFGAVPTPAKLKELVGAALAEAPDYQEALDRARIVGREQAFLIGVRVISGTLSARQAGAAYAGLAETLIEALAERVEAELVRSHGRHAGRPGGGARHGQARRPRDDRGLGPRPDHRLRL